MKTHSLRIAGGLFASLGRIFALVRRYLYLLRNSWPRLLELAYWPVIQVVLWGLIDQFFTGHSDWLAQAAGMLIAAVLLWDVLFRAQLGVSIVFFEEMYSRNLGHLFVSPLRPHELVASLLFISLLRTLLGVGAAALLAIALYQFSIFDLGLPLLAFFSNLLVMGWAIGIFVVALVLRYGLGAEGLAWAIVFAFAPLSGIYYPISSLPAWGQAVAAWLPSSYVFEGMRGVMLREGFAYELFADAVRLNVLYLLVGALLFLLAFRAARSRDLLLHVGE
ncbi:MAG: ABC transporter permease [Methylococcaceae bacterium]|nr:ABC transporter permease [Methylococcaceae bacterium]